MNKLELSYVGNIDIYQHKTFELPYIVKDKCDIIITMNVAIKQLNMISDKNTFIICLSSYQNRRNMIHRQTHIKIYRTKKHIFFSTANLSLSKFDEITLKFDRNVALDYFINNIVKDYKSKKDIRSRLKIGTFNIINVSRQN